METKKTVGQATASLVLGILSMVMFSILAGIPAVVCGHIAKSKISKNPETLKGDGIALAGLIMGYLSIAVSVLIIPAILAAVAIPLMSGNVERAMAAEAQAGCSTIATGIRIHWVQASSATNGAPSVLPGIDVGDLDGTYFNDSSYSFTMTDGDDYTIAASGNPGSDAAGETVIMSVADGDVEWMGTLLDW